MKVIQNLIIRHARPGSIQEVVRNGGRRILPSRNSKKCSFGRRLALSAFLFFGATGSGHAFTVHYVDANNSTPIAPFTNWVTAATNIQDAVDAAAAGDEVLVTNGVYQNGGTAVSQSRVAVTKVLNLRSVNGPQVTTISGEGSSSLWLRCVNLTNGAALSGFTLTNGVTFDRGGGIFCASTNAFVTNCVISGNHSENFGGGVEGGNLFYCTIKNNYAGFEGGGAEGAVLNNCVLSENRAFHDGGGAVSCRLVGCTLFGNRSLDGFGGGAEDCDLTECVLSNNLTQNFLGGGASESRLAGCLLTGNQWSGAWNCVLLNCTVAGNLGGGPSGCQLTNCIVYNNDTLGYQNYYDGDSSLSYCCTFPMPTNGVGNFTNSPLFVNPAAGDYHLQSNSPCINAGRNGLAFSALDFDGNPHTLSTTADLDGNPRIVGETVDVGAYEFQSPTSALSYQWLQQHGLPLDGSADFADPDGDGMNNWQEWKAGTDPSSATSVLRLLAISNGFAGSTVTWASVPERTYALERASNLESGFSVVLSNIVGQPTSTSITDTNAALLGLYRVRVEE
jgi:hypothetical protein